MSQHMLLTDTWERDAPDKAIPSPSAQASAGRKAAGICHRKRQNGVMQGKAAWGGGRWHIPDARRGKTGAPKKAAAAPRGLAACHTAELSTRRLLAAA